MTYKVVVGVDGSEHADAALRWALSEAKAHDGEVVAVFAWQMPFVSNPAAYSRDEIEQAGKDFLAGRLSSVAPAPPVPLTPLVAEGDPAAALVMASEGADLLVVGSRGRSPFMGAILGAVSLRCAVAAKCPVAVIKLPDDNPQAPG